jgi:hypothetical protein
MKRLTNTDMLVAARKALSAHLSTRPRTETEREAARQAALAEAAACDARSQHIYQPRVVSDIGRGPWVPDAQHSEGVLVAHSVCESLRQRNCADRARMVARSLETPAQQAWQDTLIELQGRVDYYSRLVAAE